jgi:hypothetical protein
VAVFVAVGSSMIRSGDGRTNKYDVEAGNNTYDNAVIENSKISGKNKIQNNQSMLDDIMNSTQYPKQLKELALKNEEALEFVYDYPAEHVKEHTIDLTEEASMDSVPLFVQWDKRWGYEKYSGNFFAASGCGPTTLSMVVVYLTHNREASPLAVAKYSKEAGYSVDGSGSSWTLISEGCRHYGVKAKTVALDETLSGTEAVTTEVDEIGYPYAVEFELCPDSAPNIDAILFKGPHSEFVSNWQNTGKFAFRRDGYEFVFHSYRLPAGQWTKIRIEGDAKGTSLFVDGQLQERLEGRVSEHYNEVHKRKDRIWYQETLIFPLKQLGDARMGFKGKVRNLICIPL